MTTPEPIGHGAALPAAADTRVELRGVYTPCAVSRRPGADTPLVHVAIELADGTRVLLEPPWHPAARRSPAEHAAHDGRPVRVVGTLRATVPERVPGAQTPLLPCLVDVDSIRADDDA